MSNHDVTILILLMALVTVLPRILPFWLLSGREIPPALATWLGYVPSAVLAAMLAPQLLFRTDHIDVNFSNVYFWVAIPTFVIGSLSKNIFVTVISGMGGLALLRIFV